MFLFPDSHILLLLLSRCLVSDIDVVNIIEKLITWNHSTSKDVKNVGDVVVIVEKLSI